MKVRIKNTVDSARKLYKANVPTFVIDGILGKEVEADDKLNIEFKWLEQDTTWSIPADCVEIITK